MTFKRPLPIDGTLPELAETVRTRETTLLVAPPGAGKSTRVPLGLLREPWLGGRKIVLLEPRRVAARAVARRMADELDEPVGRTVGYRMQGDTRVGPDTRIEVVTEGVLTRMLLSDPLLSGIGLVIFDEFHERSLHADTALALCLQARGLLGAGFKLLVMSATLEAEELADRLKAGKVTSDGRLYPVTVIHRDEPVREPDWLPALAATVRRALAEQEGDVLVFLPGRREIRRTMEMLAPYAGGAELIPLSGGQSAEEQDRALRPSPRGARRVILSTPVAETGLTVEGVRVVVDSGYMRVSRFSPRTGMSRLETVRIPKPSAVQRAGRAGRTAPGVCYRLWTAEEPRRLDDRRVPEIAEADLAPLVLVLKQWGAEPDELFWLTDPPAAHYRQGEELLAQLGFLAENGTLTVEGREAAMAGIHPRLARMIQAGRRLGLGTAACRLAALLEALQGRPAGAEGADLRRLLDEGRPVHPEDVARIERKTRSLVRLFLAAGPASDEIREHGPVSGSPHGARPASAASRAHGPGSGAMRAGGPVSGTEGTLGATDGMRDAADSRREADACGLLLSFAYPDRIGRNRGNGTFLLSNGRGAAFRRGDPLAEADWIVAAELDDAGPNGLILLAAPVRETELLEGHRDRLETVSTVEWSWAEKRVVARVETRLGKLPIKSAPDAAPDPERVKAAMAQAIREGGLGLLPWTRKAEQLRRRIAAMARLSGEWPDVSDEALLRDLDRWLGGELAGCRSLDDLARLPLHDALMNLLTWEQRTGLDRLLPTHLVMPSGSRVPVDYSDPEAPFVAVRLQEVFGLRETPRLAGGRLPVVFRLLSPAGRPVQITRDLAGFWRTGYFEVRKELRGRYPKHHWPDDPLAAAPTNRTKAKEGEKDRGPR